MKKQFRLKYRRKIPTIPTLEQFEKIVGTVRNQKFSDTGEDSANLIQFMGLAALGTAEASALTWSMVDWERLVNPV
jgi:hypothetical protein